MKPRHFSTLNSAIIDSVNSVCVNTALQWNFTFKFKTSSLKHQFLGRCCYRFYKFVELEWKRLYEIPQSGHCLFFHWRQQCRRDRRVKKPVKCFAWITFMRKLSASGDWIIMYRRSECLKFRLYVSFNWSHWIQEKSKNDKQL